MTRKLSLLASLALGLAACVDNRTSVEIQARAWPADPTAIPCSYAAGGQNYLGQGTYDVSLRDPSYAMGLYIQNNLADAKTLAGDGTTDENAWRVEAVKVRLNPQAYVDRYGPNPALLPITGEGVLGANGQATPPGGKGVVLADVLTSDFVASLRGAGVAAGETRSVVIGVTLQGRTLGGQKVDSGEWYTALDVCNGCLSDNPAAVTCPEGKKANQYGCSGFSQSGVVYCK